ncbi:MAG TPA: SDR family NAD(P)-dependent oxidoreductase [Rhizomicrobium sp.]|nr:SDR family NAD(P)-dependent oxidoreductase [Rhizomicrobium sp.]
MLLGPQIAAVVTGAASGLGEAAARALAGHGARVTIFDRQADKGAGVAREIGALFCEVDVTNEESVVRGFARGREVHGQERILVNCAGTGNAIRTAWRDRKSGDIRLFPLRDFERVIQINLVGTFRCIAHAAAGMLTLDPVAGERAVIINTASIAAEDGQIGQAAYSASKAGVVGLTLVVARDLAQDAIRCNTIMPGLFDTPLLESLPEHIRQQLGAQVPFPARLGNPSEYASLALEMIRNPYFNGASVRLDGAIRMPPR